MAPVGNGVQLLVNPLHPKPASVRALRPVLGSNANLFHHVLVVFKLPAEAILSHISPYPQLTGHYARLRVVAINNNHDLRVRFLRPLSMTCREMRLRFFPWVWECLELNPYTRWGSERQVVRLFKTIINISSTDTFLATSVK